jgi:Hsp20/alpha crystallin family protein
MRHEQRRRPMAEQRPRDAAQDCGVDEKNVEIKVANRVLTIKGEKKDETEERQKDYYLSERCYGAFQRSFALPEGVDADKIEANFAKSVLTVKLPNGGGAGDREEDHYEGRVTATTKACRHAK